MKCETYGDAETPPDVIPFWTYAMRHLQAARNKAEAMVLSLDGPGRNSSGGMSGEATARIAALRRL